MAYGTPALFHTGRGQTRGANEIADAIDVRNSCLAMFVDGQHSLLGDGQACGDEVEVLQICMSPQCHEHLVTGDHLSILERRHHLLDAVPSDVSYRLRATITAA